MNLITTEAELFEALSLEPSTFPYMQFVVLNSRWYGVEYHCDTRVTYSVLWKFMKASLGSTWVLGVVVIHLGNYILHV